jgi:DNA modification methylase
VRSVWRSAVSRFSSAHVAVMPTEIARRCVLAGCPPGGLVLDPFAGAGTSGIAALATGRRFLGIEQRAEYAEVARAREVVQARVRGRVRPATSQQLDLQLQTNARKADSRS